MNYNDIRSLQSIRSYPSVSILLPTHRTSPANQQDPIRVKNLLTQARERLLTEHGRRAVQPVLDKLEALAAQIDYRYALDGLALFANRELARKYYLPFTLKERVVIDETFATRDLVFALNHSPRYWVVVLSEKPTRLYEGVHDTLAEVTEFGFPMTHLGPGGEAALPGGFGIKRSAIRDEYDRQFFRHVDEGVSGCIAVDPLPIILVGVERNLAFFREVSQNNRLVCGAVTGSHDKTSAPELAKLVWPVMQAHLAQERKRAMQLLTAALGTDKHATGMGEVWQMAQAGRGELLLVEEDFHYPARLDASGLDLRPADDPNAPQALDDAVDNVIETVLLKNGRVVFVDSGALEAHQHIALILRY